MSELKEFRKANHLTQSDVANFLGGGVEKGFISQIEHGSRKLPPAQLAKLLNNSCGWDVSMLVPDSHSVSAKASESSDININIGGNQNVGGSAEVRLKAENRRLSDMIATLQDTIESLKQQLDEEKQRTNTAIREKEEYWRMIQKLIR